MLQSTANLIYETHEFFHEIGYRPKKGMIKHDRVNEQVEFTLKHAKEVGDALCVLRLYIDFLKRERKILKKCRENPEFWDQIGWRGERVVSTVSDKDSIGSYYLTNAFDLDKNTVTICSQSFGGDIFYSEKENGYFEFGKYFLRFSLWTGMDMVIDDEDGERLAVISYSEDTHVTLKDNSTKYEVVAYETGMGIFKASYINSLEGKKPSLKRCCGFIQWDIVDNKGDYGMSLLEVYDEKADLDLMFAIAASCFLVFKKALRAMEWHAVNSAITPAIAFNTMRIRR